MTTFSRPSSRPEKGMAVLYETTSNRGISYALQILDDSRSSLCLRRVLDMNAVPSFLKKIYSVLKKEAFTEESPRPKTRLTGWMGVLGKILLSETVPSAVTPSCGVKSQRTVYHDVLGVPPRTHFRTGFTGGEKQRRHTFFPVFFYNVK